MTQHEVKGEWIADLFILQVAGPRSLEVLETATGECLHDIKFAHHRPSRVGDAEVRISRMGMAGTLAYEVHGKTRDVLAIYEAILTAGEQWRCPAAIAGDIMMGCSFLLIAW